jgi:hypothetical protein
MHYIGTMKILKVTALLIIMLNVKSFAGDTTITYDMNFDGTDELINLKFNGENNPCLLTINGKSQKVEFIYAYDAVLKIIDINRNDNLREVVAVGFGNSDQQECFFYQFIDGSIVPCGHLASSYGIQTKGNNMLTENSWMGFWGPKFEYKFDTKAKTLTFVENDFYDVNQQAEVKQPFKLLASNGDNSTVTAELKPGTKITLVKADITPACEKNTGYIEDMMCDWYFIKTSDGVSGWCRLKDFSEKVDGLVWAG